MAVSAPPGRLKAAGALLVLAAAAWVPALLALHLLDPVAAVAVGRGGMRVLAVALVLVLALGLVLLLLYPPFLPLVRRQLARQRAMRQLQVPQGSELLERARSFPNPPDLLKVGRIFLDGGRPDVAMGPLAEALRRDPSFVPARYRLGLALLELGRAEEAVRQLSQVVEHESGHDYERAQLKLGEALLGAGRAEGALERILRFEQATGGTPESFHLKGRCLLVLDRGPEAREALRASVQAARDTGRRLTDDDRLSGARARWLLLRGAGAGK